MKMIWWKSFFFFLEKRNFHTEFKLKQKKNKNLPSENAITAFATTAASKGGTWTTDFNIDNRIDGNGIGKGNAKPNVALFIHILLSSSFFFFGSLLFWYSICRTTKTREKRIACARKTVTLEVQIRITLQRKGCEW